MCTSHRHLIGSPWRPSHALPPPPALSHSDSRLSRQSPQRRKLTTIGLWGLALRCPRPINAARKITPTLLHLPQRATCPHPERELAPSEPPKRIASACAVTNHLGHASYTPGHSRQDASAPIESPATQKQLNVVQALAPLQLIRATHGVPPTACIPPPSNP